MGYWSEGRIHALLAESTPPSTAVPVDDSSQVHEEIYTPLFATSGSDTPSFTEAKYEKLNLIEVVKRDGTELTSPQQSQLLQVLTSNEAAFQGRRGEYTGGAVGIILKPEAKPHRAKPYPIPLKNRDILEGEFRRQCSIGAMQRLTPEEFEGRVWAFPAFGTEEERKHLTCHRLSQTQLQPCTQRVSAFDDGGNSYICPRIHLRYKPRP